MADTIEVGTAPTQEQIIAVKAQMSQDAADAAVPPEDTPTSTRREPSPPPLETKSRKDDR